jgi:hypothetical protein
LQLKYLQNSFAQFADFISKYNRLIEQICFAILYPRAQLDVSHPRIVSLMNLNRRKNTTKNLSISLSWRWGVWERFQLQYRHRLSSVLVWSRLHAWVARPGHRPGPAPRPGPRPGHTPRPGPRPGPTPRPGPRPAPTPRPGPRPGPTPRPRPRPRLRPGAWPWPGLRLRLKLYPDPDPATKVMDGWVVRRRLMTVPTAGWLYKRG